MSYLAPLYMSILRKWMNLLRMVLFLTFLLLFSGWHGMSKMGTTFGISPFLGKIAYAQARSSTDGHVSPEVTSLREDASLNDVCLLDAQHAWAVGDAGTIWYTENGGKLWEPQDSGTIGQLTSVVFVDALHGWIGGRISSPGTDDAVGILLATEDGGRTWTRTARAMPPIDRLYFANRRVGFAVGETCAFYPTGVISTDSAGRGWTLFGESGSRYGWLDGDFCEIPTEYGAEWVGTLCGPDGVTAVTARALYSDTRYSDAENVAETNSLTKVSDAKRSTESVANQVSALSSTKKSPWNACCVGRGMPRATCFDAAYRRSMRDAPQNTVERSLPVAWAVGDGGLVLRSDSLGTRWNRPESLPSEMNPFDFRTVAVNGNNVWIAGSPGHCVWKSSDGGQNWRAVQVPSKLPIRKLVFADAQHGIAVGSLGLILLTDDGGESWTVSRGASRRVAVMAIANSIQNIPWEPLIEASGRGYRTVLILSGDMETNDMNEFLTTTATRLNSLRSRRRAAEMASMFGIAFDDSTAVTTTHETWFSAMDVATKNSSQSVENLAEDRNDAAFRTWLATRIRCYEPSILLVERDMVQSFSSGTLRRLVLEAATAAESSARRPISPLDSNTVRGGISTANIAQSGISDTHNPADALEKTTLELPASRTVSRIYEVVRDANLIETEAQGDRLVETVRLASRLGRRVVDAAATARATTQMRYPKEFTTHVVCVPLVDNVPSRSIRNGYLTGIDESAQSQARGRWTGGRTDDPQEMVCRLQYQKTEQTLQKLPNEPIASWDAWIQQELPKLPTTIGVEGMTAVALASAQQAFRSGMNGAGVRILEWYLETVPDGPATRAAQSLLLPRLYGREVVDRNETDAQSRQFKAERWYSTMQTFASGFYAPHWSLFQASIERRQGMQNAVSKRLTEIAPPSLNDVWTKLVVSENWLIVPRGDPPQGVYLCEKIATKPYLDGKLDEPFWNRDRSEWDATDASNLESAVSGMAIAEPTTASDRRVRAIRLQRSANDPYPATVRFVHDDEYLYMAIEMVEFPGQNYAQGVGKRGRDAMLESRDRMEICVDIDRDGMTWYRLAIDARGWTQDEASGDRYWNPQWFVANAVTEMTSSDQTPTPRIRSMEVAIPLAEMGVVVSDATAEKGTSGGNDASERVTGVERGVATGPTSSMLDTSQSWNFVVRRRVPGVGTVVAQPEIQTMVFR